MMTATSIGIDLEQRVSDSLKHFDAAVRASTKLHSLDDNVERQDHREDVLEELADRITAELDGQAPKASPRCRPWNYRDFIYRLRTFTPLKWFAKPSSASPLVCARFGWVNKARDTLACECCGAELQYAREPTEEAQEDVNESGGVQRAPSSTCSIHMSLHHDLCPWKENPCPKEFLQLPVLAEEDWRRDFLLRVKSVLPFRALPAVTVPEDFEKRCHGGLEALVTRTKLTSKDASPLTQGAGIMQLSSSQAESTDWALNRVRKWTPSIGSLTDIDSDGARKEQKKNDGLSDPDRCRTVQVSANENIGVAAAIAVFGWQSASTTSMLPGAGRTDGIRYERLATVTSDGKPKLLCTLCNRRVLIDNFLPAETSPCNDSADVSAIDNGAAESSRSSGGVGESGAKRRRLSAGGTPLKAMDLAREHRPFCPWATVHPDLNGEESGEAVVPGWVKALEAVVCRGDRSLEVTERREDSKSFEEVAGNKAEDALDKVQRVLNVLMRC